MDRNSIASMFNEIAYRYEFMNHVLTFYMDELWRRKLARKLVGKVLDIACGTGQVSMLASRSNNVSYVVGLDISMNMLRYARSRKTSKVSYVLADAHKLPFSDGTFDSISIAFGIRNFGNRLQALSEMYRVLRKGGKLFILELVPMEANPLISKLYSFYKDKYIPLVSSLLSRKYAYEYLSRSIDEFPKADEFKNIISKAGFEEISYTKLSLGVVAIFEAVKP